jgi:assimilatory nitrate reductase catalytic subunit
MQTNLIESTNASAVSEPRLSHLLRTGKAKPVFLQGAFPFAGRGFFTPKTLNDALVYEVPPQCTAEVVYFRAGNLSDDLVYLTLMADGKPIRYFPVGPKGDFHVPLVIVESQPSGTKLEVGFAAPRSLTGSIVVDVGIVEIPEGS